MAQNPKMTRARALASKGALSPADMMFLEQAFSDSRSMPQAPVQKGRPMSQPQGIWPDDGSSTDQADDASMELSDEISPEMIEAGVSCLSENRDSMNPEELVREIYGAMRAASASANGMDDFGGEA